MTKEKFTLPQLYKGCKKGETPDLSKPWFVFFRYEVPGHPQKAKKRVMEKGKLNTLNTISERLDEGALMIESLTEMLYDGWSPFEDNQPQENEIGLLLSDAVEMCIEGKKLKEKIKSSKRETEYRTAKRILLESKHIGNVPVKTISSKQIENTLMDQVKLKGWTGSTYNSRLKDIKAIFMWLHEKDFIDTVPTRGIERMKKSSTRRNEPLTSEEMTTIVEYLREHHYAFYMYLSYYYYSGFRMGETLSIKRSNINIETGEVILWANDEKTEKQRACIIPDVFWNEFREYIKAIPEDDYIWSSKSGFAYGPKRVSSTTSISHKWQKLIKKGLGIQKDCQGIRHTSAVDRQKEFKNLHIVRDFLGHSDIKTTQIYVRSMTQLNLEELKGSKSKFA